MKVLYLSMTDSAGQGNLLVKAMRDCLGWNAKNVILQQTYLNYDADWTFSGNQKEVAEFAEDADLFIFQDILFGIPGGPKFNRLCNPDNTIIHGLGSNMRANIPAIMDYMRTGFHVLPPLSDPTIARYIGGAPFEAVIVDPRIKELTKEIPRNDRITICHAPTKDMKGEEEFEKAVKELDVDWLVVKGKTWEEAIKEKAKAHIILDSLGDESYGLNCLEGLVMGQLVISNISPWDYCLHDDLPIRSLWNRKYKLTEILEQEITIINTDPRKGSPHYSEDAETYVKNWVYKRFSPAVQARNWKKYIEWAMQ